MVTIKIVIEGAVLLDDNTAADTFDNSEKFREGFHTLFSKIFNPGSFNLIIEPGSGYKQAIKTFVIEQQKVNCILLIDLDAPKNAKQTKLAELSLTEYAGIVFFMVQEMESWILSQPLNIIKTYADTLKYKGKLEEDAIFLKHPEDILDPTFHLKTVLGRYFTYEKNGTTKKKKYGKLKDAPLLIANLDIGALRATFDDVERLALVSFH